MEKGTARNARAGGIPSARRRTLGVGLLCFGVLDLAMIHGVLVPRLEQDHAHSSAAEVPAPPAPPSAASPLPTPSDPQVVAGSPSEAPAPKPAEIAAPVPAPAAPEPAEAPAPKPVETRAPTPTPAEAPPAPVAVAEAGTQSDAPAILFPPNTAWVSPTARKVLVRLAQTLNEQPNRRVILSGHTDELGTARLNSILSLARARRSGKILESLGIDPSRIEIQGFGATRPVDERNTPQARAQNRRVEITVR